MRSQLVGVRLAQAVMSNAKLFAPASVYVEALGTYIGYPAIIGAEGAEEVVELKLNAKEEERLARSVQYIKRSCSPTWEGLNKA